MKVEKEIKHDLMLDLLNPLIDLLEKEGFNFLIVAGKDGLCSRYAAGNKIELTDILGELCQKNPQLKNVLKEASNDYYFPTL